MISTILLQISSEADLYNIARTVALYGTALTAVVSGFKIFQKWQGGEPVVGLIVTWLLGIIIAVSLLAMIDTFIRGGTIVSHSIAPSITLLAREAHSLSIVLGAILSVVAIIQIYQKYTGGEDAVELILRWVGSIFFLLTFGYIIENLMS